MRHYIIVKFKSEITKEMQEKMYPDIKALFDETKSIPGILNIRLLPNVINRDNRYDLAIEMEMNKDALPVYDASKPHKRWKEQYGGMLENKTIIDLEDENQFLGDYTADPNRYDGRMPYKHCGNSGLKLPEISLGLWNNFGSNDSYDNMKNMLFTAFDLGITHFDLANNYGPIYGSAETNFGKIISESLRPYRDELILSTKAGYDMWPGPYGDHGSRKYLLASLDQSLKRMQVDYVDIFYHHRPDPDTPLEETMEALAQAVHSGKALYAGLSNYDGARMKEAAAILKGLHCPFIINQVRYSIIDRTIEENGLKEAAAELNKGIIVFSPLAQGLLTNKYLKGIPSDSRIARKVGTLRENAITPERLGQIEALNQIASERGQTLAQMALTWVKKDDDVTSVLIGASRPEQIIENCEILKASPLSKEELGKIDDIIL